jgi:hypothetical protein
VRQAYQRTRGLPAHPTNRRRRAGAGAGVAAAGCADLLTMRCCSGRAHESYRRQLDRRCTLELSNTLPLLMQQ